MTARASTPTWSKRVRAFYTTKRGQGGSGLGLHIVRDGAEPLGGSVSEHSGPGEGKIFTLAIPDRADGS
jgi:signal transduction histidine kinase